MGIDFDLFWENLTCNRHLYFYQQLCNLCRIPEWYQLDEKDQAQIWSPTLQIDRAKTIQRTRKFGPTEKDYLWYDSSNSILEYQQAMKVTIYCSFDFKSFPFDSNHCDFTFFASDTSLYLLLNSTKLIYRNKVCIVKIWH